MARALRLARRGLNSTTPNPRVGCVLVRDGQVIGEGWHKCAGQVHAEVHALGNCSEVPAGSTCYVTLEPCAHSGRTPPCSEALIQTGVGRVIAAMRDPNPAVAGGGLQQLAAAGIETAVGLLQEQARDINAGFCKRLRTGLPFVRAKLAVSLDGRTALANGDSRWITGDHARTDVHRLRARSCAILTGIGTALADDPRLTARLDDAVAPRQPLRVVMDTRLRLPEQARLLQEPGKTVIMAGPGAKAERRTLLEQAGADVVVLASLDTGERLTQASQRLAADYGINELMVEAGARLNGSLLRAGLVDELIVYLAPLLLGHEARPVFELAGIENIQQHVPLRLVDMRQVGHDVRLTYRPGSSEVS